MKHTFLILLLLFCIKGFCCSCRPLGEIDDKQFNSYQLIIKGQIEKIEEVDFEKIIHVKIETQYKGNIKTKIVLISSPARSGMCAIFPEIGENWLIFAIRRKGYFSTSLCTRTRNMSEDAWNYDKETIKSDLKYLKSKIE